jgi:hypothetical protein
MSGGLSPSALLGLLDATSQVVHEHHRLVVTDPDVRHAVAALAEQLTAELVGDFPGADRHASRVRDITLAHGGWLAPGPAPAGLEEARAAGLPSLNAAELEGLDADDD